jgi:hypothetical protein
MFELHEGADDCSAKFKTGQRAVFYLYPGTTQGSWIVPASTHAFGNAEPGGDDLLFLRVCRNRRSAQGSRAPSNYMKARRYRLQEGWWRSQRAQ